LNVLNGLNRLSYFGGARHRFSLDLAFQPEKVSSKRSEDAFYAVLQC
jgi:hypothetical protein